MEPETRDEPREKSEGEEVQRDHLPVTDSQVTVAGSSLRPSRHCGSIGLSSTAWIRSVPSCQRHLHAHSDAILPPAGGTRLGHSFGLLAIPLLQSTSVTRQNCRPAEEGWRTRQKPLAIALRATNIVTAALIPGWRRLLRRHSLLITYDGSFPGTGDSAHKTSGVVSLNARPALRRANDARHTDRPCPRRPLQAVCSAPGELSSLAILSQLACDSFKRASNSLVSANKPSQEFEGVYNDAYDAGDVNQKEQSPK